MSFATRSTGAVNPVPVLSFHYGAASIVDQSTVTFTAADIGTANESRNVIVCCAYRTDPSTDDSFPTVTVGGAATTRVAGQVNTTAGTVNRIGVALYITSNYFPTGSTADIVVTRGGTVLTRCLVSAYRIVKNGPLVVVLNQNTSPGSTVFVNNTLQTADRVGIAVLGAETTSALSAFSLSGAVTSDFNSGVQELGGLASGMSSLGFITYSSTGSGSSVRALLVVWR